MYIYHRRGVFLAGYDWFKGKISYFNTQIRVYHILFTDGTTDDFAAEDCDYYYYYYDYYYYYYYQFISC